MAGGADLTAGKFVQAMAKGAFLYTTHQSARSDGKRGARGGLVCGSVQGALVAHTSGGPLCGEDLATLRAYAALAAPLVVALGKEEQAGRSRFDRLSDIARAVGAGGDTRLLLREVCLKMADLCAADRCAVFLWNAATGEITPATSQMVRHQVGPEAWEQFKRMGRRRIGEMPFVDAVARARRPLAIADARGSEPASPPISALPFDRVREEAAPAPAAAQAPLEALRARFHVLMADDNEINRLVAARQLEVLGYRFTMVDNGLKAVAACARRTAAACQSSP